MKRPVKRPIKDALSPEVKALPSSGPLSMSQIQGEFGGSNPISLSEYYGAASGIPSSGAISIGDFYGKSNSGITASGTYTTTTEGGYKYFRCTGNTTFTVVGNVQVDIFLIGGGGFGGGAGGGGGGGGYTTLTTFTAAPGTYQGSVGAGRAAIMGGYNTYGPDRYQSGSTYFTGPNTSLVGAGAYNGGSRFQNNGGSSKGGSGGSGTSANNPDNGHGGGGASPNGGGGNSNGSTAGVGAAGINLAGWGSYTKIYGGGGGGGCYGNVGAAAGGMGGGGNGGTQGVSGGNGTNYLGGGGGGAGLNRIGGNGGNGVLILRYAL